MKKNTKRFVKAALGLVIILLALFFLFQWGENKIEGKIKGALKKANIGFEHVSVSLLNNHVEVLQAEYALEGKNLNVESIIAEDFNVYEYLANKKIVLGNLSIHKPSIVYRKGQEDTLPDTKSGKKKDFKEDIKIKHFSIDNAQGQIFKKDSTQNQLFLKLKKFEVENLHLNKKILQKKIPLEYDEYKLESDSLFYNANNLQKLSIGHFSANNGAIQVDRLQFLPQFSKRNFQKQLSIEKDRFLLKIEKINLSKLTWEEKQDSLHFKNPFLSIKNANLEVYRDKQLPDDLSIKPMYSAMLRNLPVKINFDSLEVQHSFVKYEEKIHAKRPPGMVKFEDIEMKIYNILNENLHREDFPLTKIHINTQFMGQSPLVVNWDFDISDKNDQFQISGKLGRVQKKGMNSFLTPALNVKIKGEIESLLFNYGGNVNRAQGDMRIKYKDFKVEVLKKNGNEKNGFLSAVANIFIKNTNNGAKEYQDIKVTRDKTKSFWNYFWLCIRNGALKSVI